MASDIQTALEEALAELTPNEAEAFTETETLEPEDHSEDVEEEAAEAEAEDLDEDEEDETEASDEVEEAEAEDDEDTEAGDIVELDGIETVRIDGEDIAVKDILARQSDYTKKTTALAEERKAFEAEREQLAEAQATMESLDSAWADSQAGVVATMLGNSDDIIDTLSDAVIELAEAGDVDPNVLVVKTILSLVSNDLIENELREMLGFDDSVVEKARETTKTDKRLRKLEKQTQRREEPQVSEEDGIEAARQELQRQWSDLVDSNEALSSLDEDALAAVRTEVARLAIDRGGLSLDVAFDLFEAKRAKLEAEAASKKQAIAKKKRATRSVSKPSNEVKSATREGPKTVEDALAEAMQELGNR